jgi:hypothetical protein
MRMAVVTASARSLPVPDVIGGAGRGREQDLHLAADQIRHRRSLAPIGHVHHVDPRPSS